MRRLMCVGLLAALVSTGCRSTGSGSGEYAAEDGSYGALAPAASQRFADIPLPDGVKVDPDRSYVYESDAIQIGRMVYTTRADANAVTQFFIEQCPMSGWHLTSVLQADGNHLDFVKPDKRLRITVRPTGVARGATLVTINLTPESDTRMPRRERENLLLEEDL